MNVARKRKLRTVGRVMAFSGIVFLCTVIFAANIVAGVYQKNITDFIYGYGANFEGEGVAAAFAAGDELCREIVEEGAVLLKNEPYSGTTPALPLTGVTAVNVFGWGATDGGFIISGSGSGSASERQNSEKQLLFLDALQEEGISYNTQLIDMYVEFKDGREGRSLNALDDTGSEFFRLYEPQRSYYTSPRMTHALNFSTTALIVISRLGGEAKDLPLVQYFSPGPPNESTSQINPSKTYLELSNEEEDLIDVVTSAGFARVVVILNTCNAMNLSFIENDKIHAALSIGAVGQSGASGVVRLLRGEKQAAVLDEEGEPVLNEAGEPLTETVKISPSGRTTSMHVYDFAADPTYVNAGFAGTRYYNTGARYIDYVEGIYVGYRYFETAHAINMPGFVYDEVVQFPFGYGKSYTQFSWAVDSVSPAANALLSHDSKIEIRVNVTNTGSYPGKDVVQCYVNVPYATGEVEKPYVQLAAFAKTPLLAPGQTAAVTVSFDIYDVASYDFEGKSPVGGSAYRGYVLDSGIYRVRLQTDSHRGANETRNCTAWQTEYRVGSAGIRYDQETTAPDTGRKLTPATNLFTGANAEGGVSIDGNPEGETPRIFYLSRANRFADFPYVSRPQRPFLSTFPPDGWRTNKSDTDVRYTQGVAGELRLSEMIDDELVYNKELIDRLGQDYDDPLWDELLNQMSVNEMIRLVTLGGYRTVAVESIGKIEALDLDGPSGLNQVNMTMADSLWTGYPGQTVLAQSFSAPLSFAFGTAVGIEARETNVSGWYAPAVNLQRNPFEGRNYEYYSEDPLLSGIMGAETVRGALSEGLYCYVKHFAVNETETARMGLYTWLTEQALREIYLRPFEICVKRGGANAIMSAFNRIGATWTGGSYALLTTILRDEWGFRGSVITDYSSGSAFMSVDQGIRAGNDLWLNPTESINAGSFNDRSSTTALHCLRQSSKNILFTYVNTAGERAPLKVFFPWWWIWGILPINVVFLGGSAVGLYFLLRPKRKKTTEITQT
ncbi:MAG: fibronectin type III-like domain-contianing protein [Firmicutes bacterium]|nr:fibronectin type III-like domain-contianing protein [Bacillota bacterium]